MPLYYVIRYFILNMQFMWAYAGLKKKDGFSSLKNTNFGPVHDRKDPSLYAEFQHEKSLKHYKKKLKS